MADALRIVRKQGDFFMQEAVPAGGAMAAVLGLDGAVIADICERHRASFPSPTITARGRSLLPEKQRRRWRLPVRR